MNNEVHYTDPSKQSSLPDIDEEQTSTYEYVQNLQPIKEQKQKTKRLWLIVLIVLLLVGAGAAIYFFVLKPKSAPVAVDQTPQQQVAEPAETVDLEMYTSEELNLSFQHLSNWKVDDETDGIVRVSSPVGKQIDVNGEQISAYLVVTFMSAGSEIPSFENTKNLIAVLDSEKIAYEKPSQNQRQQTYISFGGRSNTALDIVLITGDSGYKKEQTIPEADIKKVDPLISVMFYACANNECTSEDAELKAIQPSTWATNADTKATVELLKTLNIQ